MKKVLFFLTALLLCTFLVTFAQKSLTNVALNVSASSEARIKMPSVFSDYMVLQRDKPIRVWGEVQPGEDVSVVFNGETHNLQCDGNGKFNVFIPALGASDKSYSLSVMVADDTLSFHNVVMGDVFLCAGQSNMAFRIKNVTPDQLFDALSDADYPDLRLFDIAKVVSGGQLTGHTDKPWESATPERIPDWSAIAFFFGRDLHKHINIPVGIINCSQGGASSEAFISPEAYASDLLLNAAKRSGETGIYQYYRSPSSLYKSMVSKIVGYAINGVIWYQGEANAQYWRSFKTTFKGLINDWRTQWNEPELPWLYVQLPAYDHPGDITNMNWAETRDIQLQCWKEDPTIGMVVTMDCGETDDIHPRDKYTIAKRLLPYAKALIYDEQVIHKSPIYKSHEISGSDVFVSFENTGLGLMANKEITEFEIAGEDKVYKYAKAFLLPDNRIKLSEPTVSMPIYVRYAFRNYSSISIYTSDAFPLPLSPFKTETQKSFSIPGLGDSITRVGETFLSHLLNKYDYSNNLEI